jgi:Cu(I)/Ag(I) efflux system membrane protein CusA/SilA
MLATGDLDMLGKTVVGSAGGLPVLLEHIAEVTVGNRAPKLGVAAIRGQPAVLLTVTKQPDTGTLELTGKIDRSLAELQQTLPEGVQLSTDIFRQARFIESAIGNVGKSLYEGGIFVVIILFVFLMNVRTTVISLVSIPVSLVVSVLALKVMGLTINTMSLGGMAIAVGSLVDDAIVDVENVFKRLRENRQKPADAQLPVIRVVFEASKEVRMPILNSTLIIVASFVPLFFLSGMEGRMLAPLGITFIVALFASTLVALTLTPVLCSYLLSSEHGAHGSRYTVHGARWLTPLRACRTVHRAPCTVNPEPHREPFIVRKLKQGYRPALERALRHRKGMLGGAAVLLIAAVAVFFLLGRSFLPSFNEGSFTVNISTQPGISLDESDNLGRIAEGILLSVPEIRTTGRKTGRAERDEHALGVNVSEIEAPFTFGKRSKDAVLAEIREKLGVLPGVTVETGQPVSHRIDAMLSGTRKNIAVKIFGADLPTLFALGNRVQQAVRDVPGVVDLSVEQQVERPQLKIVPKRELLAQYGITLPQFARFINVMLAGETVSRVYEDGKVFDLTLKAGDGSRQTMDDIRNLAIDARLATGDTRLATDDSHMSQVASRASQKIPLGNVADIVSGAGPDVINRENIARKVVVSANVAGRDLRSVVGDMQAAVAGRIALPEGYRIEYGGQFESEQAASRTLLTASLLAVLVIFLLLFNQFRSVPQSLVVLLNLPLALIGGVFTLVLTGGVVSIPAIIGFISLFGIATRNGILLISRYNDLRSGGMSVRESIICGSLDRLNPILMTALCSALALIPLAVCGDLPGNEIQSPMAKVLLGGLLTSTLLNAFIIPIMYLLTEKNYEL